MLLGQGIPVLMLGYATGFDQPDLQDSGSVIVGLSVFISFMLLVVYTLTTGILVQLAHDAKLDRPVRVRRYIWPALTAVPAILLLSLVICLILFAGQMVMSLFGVASPFLLIIALPALLAFYLWVLATFSVLAPAVIIERVGLRGLGRSAALTRGYRWPIVGTLFLIGMCTIGLYIAGGFLLALISYVTGPFIGGLLFGALSMAGTGILSIAVALIYARLREIKEGVSLDQIASVFD